MIAGFLGDYSHIHFYNQDDNGIVLYANKVTADFFGAEKETDFIGKNLADFDSQKNHAEEWIINTREIMRNQTPCMFIECATTKAGKEQWFRSYRSPLYGLAGKVLGIHGLSVPVSKKILISLTNQQTACLKELALGNTHKQIANELGLSAKTVEHYLEAVKLKLNCNSRAELIMHAIERGLVGVF